MGNVFKTNNVILHLQHKCNLKPYSNLDSVSISAQAASELNFDIYVQIGLIV